MAFTVEDISKVIAGDGSVDDAAQEIAAKIVALHDEDVKGLKGTNIELKAEKTKLAEKYKTDTEKYAEAEKDFQEQLKAAQEQIKNNSPETQKTYYENQLKQLETAYKAQLESRQKTLEEKEAQLAQLEKRDLLRSQESEFSREVAKTKADPLMYEVLKTMVIGENGGRFTPHQTEDGMIFWDQNGETIKNRLDKILASDMGKHFMRYQSSGAGAEGGTGPNTSTVLSNPFKTGNLTEQQRLYREDPKTYEALKKSAGL